MTQNSSDHLLLQNKRFALAYLLVFVTIVLACAGWDLDYSQRSNVQSKNFVSPDFAPLAYYEDGRFAYAEGQFNGVDAFNAQVLQDWKTFIDDPQWDQKITYSLFEDSLAGIIATKEFLNKNNSSEKLISFFNYLIHAKNAEKYAVTTSYWWQEVNTDSLSRLISDDLLKAWEIEQFPFVKQRYAFQIIRNFFFAGNYLGAIDFYNRHVSKQSLDIIHLRCKGYVAASNHRLERYQEANLIYSELMSLDKRFTQSACQSFHPQEEIDFLSTISECQSLEQKICLWVMMAFYSGDDGRAIHEIRKLDANHQSIDLLYSRMLAKYESYHSMYGHLYWYSKEEQVSLNALSTSLEEVLGSLLQDSGFKRRYKLFGAMSYFYHLNGNQQKSNEFLNLSFNATPAADIEFKNQLMVFRVLQRSLNPESLDTVDFAFLDIVFDLDEWYNANSYRTYTDVLNNIQDYLVKTNHPAQTILFPLRDALSDNVALWKAVEFLKEKDNIPLNDFCRKYAGYTLDDLYLIIGINYTFENKVDSAIQAISQSSKMDETLYASPFSMRINDCHDCDHAEHQGPSLSRIAFLNQLKLLADKQTTTPDYTTAIELGNAFYNLSHHGNARIFSSFDYPTHGFSYINESDWYSYDFLPHYETTFAEKYYRSAIDFASNKEEKAKAYFLLSKCELASYQYGEDVQENVDFIAQEGFKALKSMEDTKFRKMVLEECGYFKTYYSKK